MRGVGFLEENQVLLHCYQKNKKLRVSSRVGLPELKSCSPITSYSGELLDLVEPHFPHKQNIVVRRLNI